MSQAEVKIRKFSEPSACNDGGNTEPSPVEREGAETKHGLCLKCNGQIPSDKYRNAKYCSTKCRNATTSYRHRVKSGKIQLPGVGSGNNQGHGKNNSKYRTGIGLYSKLGFKHHGRICNRCAVTNNLLVHHIDEDRTNNSISNLEVLCKKCHQNHHCIRDNSSGKFVSQT